MPARKAPTSSTRAAGGGSGPSNYVGRAHVNHLGDFPSLLALAAAIFGPLLLYVFTLPRTVVFEDDGLFLMSGAHLGISHPPGYPLYTLVCHLFMQLPFGSPAFLGHLSSAALGAAACGLAYLCARLLGASILPALVGAWLFGASEHFWSQAIIAEVYTLNALFFFAVYALLLYGVRRPQHTYVWLLAAGVYGLSLANHWPLMVLAIPGLAVMILPVWRDVCGRLPALLGVSAVSAALPYAWMVWRSRQDPLISFYGPIKDWDGLWFYVSRSGYSEVDVSPSAGWEDRFAFLQWFANEMVWQLTLPGFALVIVGLISLFRGGQRAAAVSGVLVFLGQSVLLLLLLSMEYDTFHVSIFRPYSLVCYGLAALWLALGLQFLLDRLPAKPLAARGGTWRKTATAALAGLIMTALSVHAHWPRNDRSGSELTHRYAKILLDFLPRDAVLFVHGDSDTGPLGYYHFVEEYRADITLLNTQGLVYGNRLYSHTTPKTRRKRILQDYLDTTERRVFFTVRPDEYIEGHKTRHYGFITEVLREHDTSVLELHFNPSESDYFAAILDERPGDRWEALVYNQSLHRYGKYLGYATLASAPRLLKQTKQVRALAETNFFSLIGMIEVVMEFGQPAHAPQLEDWLERAENLHTSGHPGELDKELRARFLYLQGFMHSRQGRREEAIALFKESWAVYPHPENASAGALRQLGQSLRGQSL